MAADAIERHLVLFIGAGVSAGAGVDTWKGLFEDAVGRDAIAILPRDPRKTDGRLLLKLHGSVDKPEEMILTRADTSGCRASTAP